MILNDLKSLKKNFFSVIIIGSGPAGISTALKLEEFDIKTLIIEAGGLEMNSDSEDFLKGNIMTKNYNDISTTRARMFGGTSNLWGGHCNKFEKNQFDSWPIDYDTLHEYEKQANKILDLKSYHSDFYVKKFNKDFNQYNSRFAGESRNFKDSYYDKIKNSKNIFLSLNTTFLHVNNKNRKIVSVHCKKKDYFVDLKAKYYVLAAGGIENSRLLLWSKQKNKDLFEDETPIGKYYMDHPWYSAADGFIRYNELANYLNMTKKNSREFFIDCYNRVLLFPNLDFRKEKNIDSLTMFLRFSNRDHANQSYIRKISCIAPGFIKKFIEKKKEEDLIKFTVTINQEQEPDINNQITLGKKLDPFNIPLIDLKWTMSDKMKRAAKENLINLGNFLIKKDLGRISIDEHIFSYKNFKTHFNGRHQMGGTCVGDDYKKSVVDKNLKVHSLENLFITGSSVFKTSGHGNPTYTIVLLSLKLGEHLKKII